MIAKMVALSQVSTELFPFLISAITSFFPKHISESIYGNLMKLGTLREGNEKKSIVQEAKPFRKL